MIAESSQSLNSGRTLPTGPRAAGAAVRMTGAGTSGGEVAGTWTGTVAIRTGVGGGGADRKDSGERGGDDMPALGGEGNAARAGINDDGAGAGGATLRGVPQRPQNAEMFATWFPHFVHGLVGVMVVMMLLLHGCMRASPK